MWSVCSGTPSSSSHHMRLRTFAGSGHNASPINDPPGIRPTVAVRLTMSGWVLFGSGTI